MLPYWNLGGTLFPTYSLLTLLGAAAAWLYFHRQLKARGENPGRTEQAFLFGVLGALVGAKFLYLLLQLPQLLQDLPLLAADPAAFSARYLSGGFVFYGGLFGALAAVWLFCRRRKVPFSQLGADLVPAVPLFHTFGRVGCFLAGCCYGIPAPAGWPGVTFRVSPVAPNGVALLPVQLYEAAGCLLLFLLLHRLARRGWKGEALLLVYLAAYALFRFALEFLRGDAARGMWGVFSTSQLLALVTLAAVLPLLIRHLRTYGKQPRLFFVSAPPPPLHQEPASWNRLSKSYVERKSRNASIREAISWAVIGSSSRSRRASSWHTSGE